MNLQKSEERATIQNIQHFDLKRTFECGQCFRWFKQEDGTYTGVVRGHVFNVGKNGQSMVVKSDMPQPDIIMNDYLDTAADYSEIQLQLSSEDDIMKKAVNFGQGIRILKQEHWECLVSFIISARNNIPCIMKSIEKIAHMFGEPVEFEGSIYYTFPQPEKLADITEGQLSLCGVGFRSKYIRNAARIISSGEIDLQVIENMDSDTAREELMRIPGVGRKVADCVLLYSYSKKDVFPIDVWIKRVVEELYLGREAKLAEIQDFARDKFGLLAGMAQQYLFYYARENKIGK